MIEFINIKFLFLLVLIVPFYLLIKNKKTNLDNIFSSIILDKIKLQNSGISNKTRSILLLGAFTFMVIALSRPIINNGKIKIKSSFVNVVVAIDMSRSMFANDIYPNRFEFAKKKFNTMLDDFKNSRISLIGFSNQTFLISPLTQDFHSLKFLTSNLNLNTMSLKGTDILNTLKTANELMKDQDKKILFLLTDGSDQKDFSKELQYAKDNHITIYIYGIGTKKGGVIKIGNDVLKDKNGNIVVVRLNDNIKTLAIKSGGAYMSQTLQKDDIKLLINHIKNKFKAKQTKENFIKDKKELFIYPLIISFVLLFMGLFSFPNRKELK